MTKAGSNLNVRESSATSAKFLTQLPQGAIFTALAGPREADGYSWLHIRTGDRIRGWRVDVQGCYVFETTP